MPLNSKPQNLHHFYSNHESQFVHIADGPDLVVEQPCDDHPDEFHVLKDETVIYKYNPTISLSGVPPADPEGAS